MKCLSSRTLMAIVAIATVTLAAGAVGMGVASAATQGYTWITPSAAATKPAGLNVYVVKGSRAGALTAATTYAVSQQRRYGIRVRWGGYSRSTKRADGIVVYQRNDCAQDVLGRGGPTWTGTPVSGLVEILSGIAEVCPAAFASASMLRAVVLHELGHAVGLGHFNSRCDRRYDIMRAVVNDEVLSDRTYQPGDINGLHAVVHNTATLGKSQYARRRPADHGLRWDGGQLGRVVDDAIRSDSNFGND